MLRDLEIDFAHFPADDLSFWVSVVHEYILIMSKSGSIYGVSDKPLSIPHRNSVVRRFTADLFLDLRHVSIYDKSVVNGSADSNFDWVQTVLLDADQCNDGWW